jgi:hypothetical protein
MAKWVVADRSAAARAGDRRRRGSDGQPRRLAGAGSGVDGRGPASGAVVLIEVDVEVGDGLGGGWTRGGIRRLRAREAANGGVDNRFLAVGKCARVLPRRQFGGPGGGPPAGARPAAGPPAGPPTGGGPPAGAPRCRRGPRPRSPRNSSGRVYNPVKTGFTQHYRVGIRFAANESNPGSYARHVSLGMDGARAAAQLARHCNQSSACRA